MRDVNDYAEKYTTDDFENEYQVKYRRKKMIELVKKYPHKNILETGCAFESFAKFFDDFDHFTIVEPADKFYKNAVETFKDRKNVDVVYGLFEKSIAKLNDILKRRGGGGIRLHNCFVVAPRVRTTD